ncbi:Tetratricopeptide-like helical [Cynara cardunculus var. scolymus]|uniref:protein O-GlcNAc transferase n=1 Tax=Cynara cardunculus var. scolymus TaxID=59895 RepID=A0A103XUC9_CYNCS|nr:Tetratricopeptide-like helical [Cynara cardunculus var. scolymus]
MAIIYKQQVLHFDPLAADGLVHHGNTHKEIGRVNEAIQDYSHDIIICPHMDKASANLASVYKDNGHVEAAIKSYRQALAMHPDFSEATHNLLHTLQYYTPETNQNIGYSWGCKLSMRLRIPLIQTLHLKSIGTFNPPLPLPTKCKEGNNQLHIRYASSDFINHPLSVLMGLVFGMHDRENVEVSFYALTHNDWSEWRLRIQSEAELFKDISTMTSDMISSLIIEDQI